MERRRQDDPAGAALVRCSARMAPSASHSTHSHFCTGACLRRRARRLCARLPLRRRHSCRSWPVASFSGFWCCGASGGCGGCFRRQPRARGAGHAHTLLAARQHRFQQQQHQRRDHVHNTGFFQRRRPSRLRTSAGCCSERRARHCCGALLCAGQKCALSDSLVEPSERRCDSHQQRWKRERWRQRLGWSDRPGGL